MKKVLVAIFLIVIVSLAGFIGGYWYYMHTSVVTISVRNNSSKNIMSIRVLYDRGEIVTSGFKKKKEKKIKFYTKVNGTYRLFVTFDNDKNIESEKRQFEPGDTGKEIVLDTAIIASTL